MFLNHHHCLHPSLIDLNRGIDEPCEPETSIEPYRSREHKKCARRDEHVPKVKHRRHQFCDLKLCEEVERRVEE